MRKTSARPTTWWTNRRIAPRAMPIGDANKHAPSHRPRSWCRQTWLWYPTNIDVYRSRSGGGSCDYFEVVQAHLITGQDAGHGKEGERKQGSHCIGHRFGYPIGSEKNDNIGTSSLLKHVTRISIEHSSSTVLTIVLMTSGIGNRTNGVMKMNRRRHHRLLHVKPREMIAIAEVVQMLCYDIGYR